MQGTENVIKDSTEVDYLNKSFKSNTYSIIPTEILFNKDLKANEKLLYAIIYSLSNKEGYCFASNKYLAKKLGVNYKTISSWISNLRNKKYISTKIITNEKKQITHRRIYTVFKPYQFNNGYRYPSKNGQAIRQNMEDNNINNNIKIINKETKKFISNYTNQREYPKDFLESLYSNTKFIE